VLLTGSGDELCDPLTSVSGLSLTCSQPSCLSSVCLLILCTEINSLPLPPSLVHFQCACPLCCCARSQFAVSCSVFLGGVTLPRGFTSLSQGLLGEFHMTRGVYLFVLSNVWKTGLKPAAAAAVAVAAL
jgi:hypothetical protein